MTPRVAGVSNLQFCCWLRLATNVFPPNSKREEEVYSYRVVVVLLLVLGEFEEEGDQGGELQQHRGEQCRAAAAADAIHEQFQNQTQVARQNCEQRNYYDVGTTTPISPFFLILYQTLVIISRREK